MQDTFNLTTLLPRNRAYFTYSGSLTTPPCTENVNWVIFKQPMRASVEELTELKANMPLNNYRTEQALNSRPVWLVKE